MGLHPAMSPSKPGFPRRSRVDPRKISNEDTIMSTPQYPSDRPERLSSSEGGSHARSPEQPNSTSNYPTQQYQRQPQHPTEPLYPTTHDTTARATVAEETAPPIARREVVAKEKEQFGGVKVGSAFFGWLTTVGTLILLSGLAAAIITFLGTNGVDTSIDTGGGAAGQVEDNVTAMGFDGILGAIVAVVIVFIAYYCGGYVAGRMARFDGAKQGVAVWVWSIVIAIVLGIVAAVGSRQLSSVIPTDMVPQMSMTNDSVTASLITLGIAVLVSLGGAILGGLAGMRFHRKVDRAGLGR